MCDEIRGELIINESRGGTVHMENRIYTNKTSVDRYPGI